MQATHNSATGERGKGLLSWIVMPFSKCQSKNLTEQYAAGCRIFDIRVRRDKKGNWKAAHGLWTSEGRIGRLLHCLDVKAHTANEAAYYLLTYEGKLPDNSDEMSEFRRFADAMSHAFPYLRRVQLAVKKPEWRVLEQSEMPSYEIDYEVLTWPNLRVLLPIPWLWAKVRKFRSKNNDNSKTKMVDFL